MKLNDKVSTAWSNLGRRKVRTALTSMGVVVGITTIVTLISLVNGVQFQVHEQFAKLGLDRVVARPKAQTSFGGDFDPFGSGTRTKIIGAADIERWKEWPEVKAVVPTIQLPLTATSGLEINGKSRPVRVVDANSLGNNPFAALVGEEPTPVAGTVEMPEGAKGLMVLSEGALRRTGLKPQEAVGKTAQIVLRTSRGEHQEYTLKIIGVSSVRGAEAQVSTPDCVSMKSWWYNDPDPLKSEGYDSVMLRTEDVTQARGVAKRMRAEGYEVQSIDALLDVADRIFQVIKGMLLMVSSVTFFVACIGIINTMIMAIYERTREIGTLKAMGASKGDIRLMFMAEAGFIGLIGGFVGLALGWLVGRGLTSLTKFIASRSNLPSADLFLITPGLVVGALFFATLIGILAGLYPANRAAGLDPLVALRHE